jgi:hypothetical protein
MKPRKYYVVSLVVLAAIGTAVVVAYSTVWHLAIFTMVPCLGSVLGVVLTLVAIIWCRKRTTNEVLWLGRVRQGLLLVGIFLILQAAYIPLALTLRDLEVGRAQEFVTGLTPRLEEYKQQHNEYPASAEAVLTGDEKMPRLLQLHGDFPLEYDNRRPYFRRGSSYGFRFYLPDGFIGFQYEYCCGEKGKWTITD